jgi:hypothetical protein
MDKNTKKKLIFKKTPVETSQKTLEIVYNTTICKKKSP